jgi:hypothetical protein
VTPSPLLLATVFVAGVLALLPAARLRAAGWSGSAAGAYWLALVGLAVVLVVERAGFRLLLPLLLVGYLAPIVVVRLRRRFGTIVRRR